jgi:general secretion pathway protein J
VNPSNQRHSGFTLLELLVVMVLLSVIMLGLVSALRSMVQAENRIDQRLDRLDEIRLARTFLQQILGRVSELASDPPGGVGKKAIPFIATADSLSWVGILPARPDVGGRQFFQLAIENASAGPALVLHFAPWSPDAPMPNWRSTDSRVLLKDVRTISVQAQGLAPQGRNPLDPWPMGWQKGWPIADALPEQLRLDAYSARGSVLSLTIPLYALPGGDSTFSQVSFGGGGSK